MTQQPDSPPSSRRSTIIAIGLIAVAVVGVVIYTFAVAPEPAGPARGAGQPQPSSSATTAAPLPLGRTAPDGYGARLSVLDYRDNVPTVAADRGERYAAIDVRQCGGISDTSWALVDRDGGVYETEGVTYRDYPKPEFPSGEVDLTGRCVHGWLMIPVTGGAEITQAMYIGGDESVSWKLPAT